MVMFNVQFNKSDRRYSTGETIHCKIHVQVPEQFKARFLSIRFKGTAHTEWTESRTVTENNETRTVYDTYTGNQEFFKYYHYFFGTQDGPAKIIDPGSYDYEASFTLPPSLPSNFDDEKGYIRYTVKIIYNVPWGFDKQHVETISVAPVINLNELSHLTQPISDDNQKTFGCCCWESEPLEMKTIMTRTGWCPGEVIPVAIEVNNNSNVKMECVELSLVEEITYKTTTPHTERRFETNEISEQTLGTTIAPFQKRILNAQIQLTPHYPWKYLNGCDLIESEYFVKATAVAAGCCRYNLSNKTKIFLGTIPPSQEFSVTDGIALTPQEFMPSAPIEDVVTEQPLPSYDDVVHNAPAADKSSIGWIANPTEPGGQEKEPMPPSFEESENARLVAPETPSPPYPTKQ